MPPKIKYNKNNRTVKEELNKKTFAKFNFFITLLFGVFVLSMLFIDYPKYVIITISSIYLIYAIIRAIILLKYLKMIKNHSHSPAADWQKCESCNTLFTYIINF